MRNKSLLIFSFCIISFCINAQTVWLQKNGRLKAIQLDLPKRFSVLYQSDSGVVSYKGRAYDYMFPYLLLKRKSDTLVLDVRKIEGLRFTSPVIALNYMGVFVTSDLTIALMLGAEFGFALIPATFTYLLIDNAHRNLDTKTKWSFD